MQTKSTRSLFCLLSLFMLFNVGCDRLKKTTPLISALRDGDVAKVKKLLKQGAKVNTTLRDGSTPMTAAAQSGKLELIKLLLSKGANPNATDNDNKTPLIYANDHCSGAEHYPCIKTLIEKGADPKPLQGKVSIMVPVCQGGKDAFNAEAYEYYIKKGLAKVSHDLGKLGTPMHCAARHNALEFARFLLKHGAKATINKRDHKGKTALHIACDRGKDRLALIKLLIKRGIDVNALDQQKKPAYYYLSTGYAKDVMLYLLARGVKPDTPNVYLGDPKKKCKDAKDDAALLTCIKALLATRPPTSR